MDIIPPYGTLIWSEGKGTETALSGVTAGFGIAATRTTMPGYTSSGDYYELKKGYGNPMIVGFGAYSLTKMQGSALSGNRSRNQERWLGPGSSNNFPSKGWAKDLRLGFQQGERVSAYCCSDADEYDLVGADVVYGAPHNYPKTINEAVALGGGFSEVYSIDGSLTTTVGSCTDADGKEAMDVTTTQDLWLDSDSMYSIIGVMPNIGLANGGGLLRVTALPQAWDGGVPAIPIPEQSGVTFDAGELSLAYEPIGPFPGDALPQLEIVAPTAGAELFGLLVGKK